MKRFTKDRRGFTMIELMVVVVIVAILAAIAIPLYGKYIDNARTTEASGRLGELATAAKAAYQETGAWPSGNTQLFDVSTSTSNFDYAITSGGGGTGAFEVTATGKNKMAGTTVVMNIPTVDDTGTITVN